MMGKVKLVSSGGQKTSSNEFFYAPRGQVLLDAGGAAHEVELELAPDHGGHAQQRPAIFAEPLKATPDHLAHALRQCRDLSRAVLQSAHRFDDHERVAFGGDPDLL